MNVITCVYCGHAYPAGTPASGADVAVLTNHIKICPKHPMRLLEEEILKLKKTISQLQDNSPNCGACAETLWCGSTGNSHTCNIDAEKRGMYKASQIIRGDGMRMVNNYTMADELEGMADKL